MKRTIIIFFLPILISSCTDKREKIGVDVYLKIVQYKKTNGRLPNKLNDIGVEEKMDGQIYYQKQTDSTFIIYYGGGLGESIVFDPLTKEWKSDRQ